MTNTYDPATPIGRVRMLCWDKGPDWIFSDEEISAYLSLGEGDPLLAGALALEDIASSQAKQDKVKEVKGIGLVTGIDIAKQLMTRAAALREGVLNVSAFGVIDLG